jgi:hypothetical protein
MRAGSEMAALEFRDGRYFLRTSWPGPVMPGTPLLTAVVMTVILVTWARGSGIAAPPEVLVSVAVLCAAFFLATLLSAARLSRPLVVDPSAGTIRFIRRSCSRSVRAVTIQVSDVREVVLSSRAGEWYGRPGGRFYIVRLITGLGEEDLLATRNPEEARSIAQQLGGILSRSLRDLT